MSNIFVSIINFNGAKNTLDCLNSLNKVLKQDFGLNIVIVDNGSSEKLTIDEDSYKNFSLKLIKSDKNLGFSGGQNLGIKYSLENGADFVVILNNDVTLDKDIFVELLKTFKEKKDCGAVSPKIYFAKGSEFHKVRYKEEDLGKVIWYAGGQMDWQNIIGSHKGVDEVDKGQFETEEETDFVSGCCMFVKKEVFEKVGFFDERYFLYYEDNDFSQRVKKSGYKIYYQPKAILWHLNAGSSGSGSILHDYYITRNRLLFGFKYARQKVKLALFKESIKILLSGRNWQKIGIKDYYLQNFGIGSYKV
jgi:hypothetical protein